MDAQSAATTAQTTATAAQTTADAVQAAQAGTVTDVDVSDDGTRLVLTRSDPANNQERTIPDALQPQAWAQKGNTDTIPTDKLPATPGSGGRPSFTSLGSASLSQNSYVFGTSGAQAIANALIDDNPEYAGLVIHLEDFGRHQQPWRIPLGLEDYAEGTNHQFYSCYVNNSTGALSGMVFSVRRNTGQAPVVTLAMLTTDVFDSGTALTIYGES